MKRTRSMKRQQDHQHLILYAYHEAGHALVGHLIGRCIERIALAYGKGAYRGYCRFSSFLEDANQHPQWHDTSNNPDLITIYYAGMLAMASVCAANEGVDDYLEGSEQSDLEMIHRLLLQMGVVEHERSHLTERCWRQAQQLLGDHWDAVDELATLLIERGTVTGGEAHALLRHSLSESHFDWRLQAWNIQEGDDVSKQSANSPHGDHQRLP